VTDSEERDEEPAADEETADAERQPELAIDAFYDLLEDRERPVVTASEVARALDCSHAVAEDALAELVEEGRVERQAVSNDPVVWYPTDWKETQGRERVVVFPNRREVVVDQPSQFTRAQLSTFARLEDVNGERGYRYVVREDDIWRAPQETFEALQRSMRQALGGRYEALEEWAEGQWERARKFRLYTHEEGYVVLAAASADLLGNVAEQHLAEGVLRARIDDTEAWVAEDRTAEVKRTLYEAGYPVLDERTLDEGDELPLELHLQLRDYQQDWVKRFISKGSGVLVGPPGSGKTVAAVGIMAAIEGETLILVPSRELASQWHEELLANTSLTEEQIGEYHGGAKEVRPVTIATYQTAGMDRHRHIFEDRRWGLIVYDEVHHIPAPISRRSAQLQTKHRVGLSVDGETVFPIRRDGNVEMVKIEDFAGEYLDDGEGIESIAGVETLAVTGAGSVEWTDVNAVMRHRHEDSVYTVRARNGRQVTVTQDHSLMVFDSERNEIRTKLPKDLSETDYLLQPDAVPACGERVESVDLMSYLDEGYVLLRDEVPDQVFEPLYERSIGSNRDRYNWKTRRSLPLSVARRIDVSREYVQGVYTRKRNLYVPPSVPVADFARLVGLFLADGAFDESRVEFYAEDSDEKSEVEAFEQVIRAICPEADISRIKNGENCTTLRVSGPLGRILESVGLSNGARQKSIPSEILTNPAAYEPFVEGLVLGDGHRQQRPRNKEMVTVSTSSDELSQGLNLILSALGHVGGNYRRNCDFEGRPGTHDTTTNNLVRFNPKNRGGGSRLSRPPFGSKLRDAFDSLEPYDIAHDGSGFAIQSGMDHRSRLNRRELRMLLDRSEVDAEWLLETDLAMLEVDSVSEAGDREFVYDISTATENFLGDHLFVHNSASPIREDDKEDEIYTLIGPPVGTDWEGLFEAGYVAEPEVEIRFVPWASDLHENEYASADGHERRMAAATNPAKAAEIEAIRRDHVGEKTLIFVEYIEQGNELADELGAPFVSGETPHARRRKLFEEFRTGPRDALIVSRVGDEGIDLPGAEVAIAASGLGGSRRQGAQRAGRTMRPVGKARMYVLATRGTREEEFARQRTRHLASKGVRVRERDSAAWSFEAGEATAAGNEPTEGSDPGALEGADDDEPE
jgi:superfamily II DNA or RNA helicase/intein/homing endonuclease